MREAASRGFWVASRVLYGYTKLMVQDGAKKRPTLEPDPATAPVVKRIFGMAESGKGITDIARTLNDEGIANPTGRLWSGEPTPRTRPSRCGWRRHSPP